MSFESDKPPPVRVHIVVAGEEEGNSNDDVHYCGKCKLVFTNIKEYLEHKVSHDSCRVTYSRSGKDKRMLIPNVVPKKAEVKGQDPNQDGDNDEGNSQEKPVRKRGKRSVVDESLITEKVTYSCSVCGHDFNRVASLKRHLEYDHGLKADGEACDQVTQTEDSDNDTLDSRDNDGEVDEEDYRPTPKRPRSRKSNDIVEKPHTCEICGNKFKEANVLKTHLLTHSNQRDFRCTEEGCNYAFKTKGSLTRHLRRHTGEKPYSCNLCGRSFAESGALTRHLKSRTSCKFKSDTDLPRYGKRWGFDFATAGEGTAKTGPADSTVITADPVVQVEQSETGQSVTRIDTEVSTIIETQADQEISSETVALDAEIGGDDEGKNESGNEMGNICRVCQINCPDVEELKAHLKIHLADTSFRCELCHFVADNREQLAQHRLSIHNEDKSSLGVLSGADSTAEDASTAEKALRDAKLAVEQLMDLQGQSTEVSSAPSIHGEKTVHTCPICQRTFRGQGYINQHMKSHTGERPYKCSLCTKTFTCKDTLTKHLSVHSEERQYKCGECGKLFKRISHVREHLKIHSGDRPYQCNICEKSFKTANAAKVHSRTHSDVLPYKCSYCKRMFREKGSLQRHIRMHTGEKPFKCKHCGRAFAEHGTLGRHLKAKVPCTYFPPRSTGNETQEKYPTVLAEFSSVVADTQQYIVPETMTVEDSLGQADSQGTTEFVVVQSSDIPVETIQNVEIIASAGSGEPVVLKGAEDMTEGSHYVVLGEQGDDLRVLDPRTGQTVATLPAHMVNVSQSEGDIETLVMNAGNTIEGIVMNTESTDMSEFHAETVDMDVEEYLSRVRTLNTDQGHSEVVTVDQDGLVQTVGGNPSDTQVQTEPMNSREILVQNVTAQFDGSQIQGAAVNLDDSTGHPVALVPGPSDTIVLMTDSEVENTTEQTVLQVNTLSENSAHVTVESDTGGEPQV